MGSVRLQSVNKQFGGQIVLRDVTLDLHTNQIAALIGPNGAGKTTIFRLVAGQYPPDTGTVTVSKGLEVGYLAQEPTIALDLTLRAAVAEAFAELLALEQRLHDVSEQLAAEHDGPRAPELMAQYDRLHARFETAGGYTFEQRLNEVLGGLGFQPRDYDLPVTALSGGQKCRAALAQLLLAGAARDSSGAADQFLLLDEPTNHLDIDAVRWLEKFLVGHHGGAVIISHDRYLLDRLAERTIEVMPTGDGARVDSYIGNYSKYVETKELRRLSQERQYEQDKAFVDKEREYIARYGAGQRARQAQGRLKRLERQLADGEFTLERESDRRNVKLDFGSAAGGRPTGVGGHPAGAGGHPAGRGGPPAGWGGHPARQSRGQTAGTRAGTEIIRTESLRKAYGEKLLFQNLDLELYAGQRLGITGPNGTGKTTLLKIILGQVPADAGKLRVAPTARIGYFSQEGGGLDPDKTVVDEIISIRPDLLERDARHLAARFLFTGEDCFKRVGSLSGGEQSRVRFLKLILSGPDVLIMDEPTNHLDIPSREALEAAIDEFPGTVVAVSHDRYFLDQVAEKLLVIRPEGWKLYPGNYTYYIEQIERVRVEAEAQEEAARAAAAEERKRKEKAARKAARDERDARAARDALTGRGNRARSASEGANRARSASEGADGANLTEEAAALYAKRSAARAALEKHLKKLKLDALEDYIHDHERRVTALQQRFGDPAVYKDPALLEQLQAEFEVVKEELATAEEEWLARAES